jgi:hypothetical protein
MCLGGNAGRAAHLCVELLLGQLNVCRGALTESIQHARILLHQAAAQNGAESEGGAVYSVVFANVGMCGNLSGPGSNIELRLSAA